MQRRAAFLAAALAVASLLAGCGRLDRDAVRTEVEKIGSATSEGMLVAREAARGRAFEGFVQIRAAELHGEVEKAEEKLDSTPAEDGFGHEADRAVSLAAQARSLLAELHEHPNDQHEAARIARQLSELSDKVDEVESAL